MHVFDLYTRPSPIEASYEEAATERLIIKLITVTYNTYGRSI